VSVALNPHDKREFDQENQIMPLEIRELVIKASINDGEQRQNPNQGLAANNTDIGDRADIIAACVEQVLAILKEQSER